MNTFPARTTNSGRLDPTKGSLARQILCTMSTKGSEKGRETNDANGYQGLKKGRETQRRAFKKLANAKWQALQNGPVLV